MQMTKLMLVLLGFAATLFAADPYVGTWIMNTAHAKYKVGEAPKEQTLTITEMGSDLNIKVSGIAADGSKISVIYTVPAAGGTGKMLETAAYDGVSSRRVGANEREISYIKAGKAIYTTHSKLSADGSALTVSSKGINALGKSIEAEAVYDKQK